MACDEYFLLGFLLILLFHLQKAEAKSMTRASSAACQRKCGNIEIPYPFGMTKECYLDETFAVRCNQSTHTPALLDTGNLDMDFISFENHTLHTRLEAAPLDTLEDVLISRSFLPPDYMGSQLLTTSFATNKIVVMGCDIYTCLIDHDTKEFIAGCVTLCNQTDIKPSPSLPCAGLHCCEIVIPQDERLMSLSFKTINNTTKNSRGYQCGYLSFVDEDFRSSDKIGVPECNKSYLFPVTYEWAVGFSSCNETKGTKDYACGQNTDCDNDKISGGYRCQCQNGYRGNPYLSDRCQDVNECEEKKDTCSRKNQNCVNTQGGYHCKPNHGRPYAMLIALGTGIPVGVLILIGIGFWGWRKLKEIKERKMKQNFFKRNGGLLLQQQISSSGGRVLLELIHFVIEELEKATDNFNENRILGKGGLGTVYKGMLSDGRIVAVKKANLIDESQVDQFINEVFILSQINHRNIVKLFGCCLETQVPLLIYEHVSNGTLSNHLHNDPNISTISWDNRLRIAAEVAGALAYLHSFASTAIFHRDIKSSNILLDENYKAFISDFGLSRSVSIDKTHLTTLVGGTFGYLDPEYFRSGQLNDKSDVYAFGVVLAEILTGQKAVSSVKDDVGLALRFRSAVKEQHLFEIMEEVVVREDLGFLATGSTDINDFLHLERRFFREKMAEHLASILGTEKAR